MSKKNITTIREAYDSFARGDYTGLPMDKHIEWIEPDVEGLWASGTHHGPEAVIKEVFKPSFEKVDKFRLRCDEFLEVGDQVIVTGRFLGRGKATGNELSSPFAHFWTLRDGKVVRFRNYADTANLLRVLYHVHLEEPVPAHH